MFNVATSLELGKNGRLGNMMFQIAATIGYAASHGKMWSFPDVEEAKYFKDFPVGACGANHEIIKEEGFCYKELPSFSDRDVSLSGYFQTKLYFDKHESLIKSAFTFSDQIQDKCKAIISPEQKTSEYAGERKITAVHFRFGDYVNNNFYCQLWETNYYRRAFEALRFRLSPFNEWTPFVFVFSDDKTRAEEEIKKLQLGSHFEYKIIDGLNPGEDMCLMSMCNQHVIANSSFSWWGAYLSKQERVIAPSQWFGPAANLDTKDLLPTNWIKI